jgi:branched-chain amino acid transport system substrate-binding protein
VHDNSEYGKGLAELVRRGAERYGVRSQLFEAIDPRATDYSAVVNKIRAVRPAAVYYGGYYPEAGRLVKQLRDRAVQAAFLSGDGSHDPGFVQAAGPVAAEGAEVTCPCADPTVPGRPAAGVFAAAYEKRFGTRPGAFSAEGYDAAGIFLEAVRRGHMTRSAILQFLEGGLGTYAGVTKDVAFQPNGEVGGGPVYVYVFRGGTLAFKGTTAELAP